VEFSGEVAVVVDEWDAALVVDADERAAVGVTLVT
jgi:hypothetical protein